ncbi:O-acetyltransferase OatA [Corynebacterium ciconiae DSM 44920]|uniref:acyltransferase family protein n=1 Tax=Corynebacterium ciconiae TaxID=227319 RepID=UPI000366A7FA|nr:acyltransferase family protein [Corynebacterium ciconiae]WKD62170.1 O-acetyltransferase OatA [Corynebacterium ciconiae DSM 44920]
MSSSSTVRAAGATSPSRHAFTVRKVGAIDGLRGLAVGSVVLYHFFGGLLPGGYLGVDIFFVLSGFLITSLLVRERAVTGRVDLKDFWLRRIRRIFPAAIVVLVVVTALAGVVGGDPSVGLRSQFFGTLFFVNNWVQIAGAQSYFADSGVQVFAHYWSLAVEEQFYLLFPLLFVALTRTRLRVRRVAAVLVVLAAASFAWMVHSYDPEVDPTRVYYGTDTHAYGLLIGAAAAVVLTSRRGDSRADSWPTEHYTPTMRRWLGRGAVVALAVLGVLLLSMADTAPITYRGGLLVASISSAVLVWAVVVGAGPVPRIFDRAPMRWLGRVSFSLYLWHWPVVVLCTQLGRAVGDGRHPIVVGLIASLVSLPLSAWSFAYIETPIRRHGYRAVIGALWYTRSANAVIEKKRLRRKEAAGAVVALTACTTAFALATSPSQTQLERDLAVLAAQQREAEQADELHNENRVMPAGDRISAIGDSVMLASSEALAEEFPGIYVSASVSSHYKEALEVVQRMDGEGTLDPFVVLSFGTNGAASGAYEGLMEDLLRSIGPDRVVVLVLPYGDRWYMAEAEQEVLDAAATHENVYVADWCHAVRDHPELLREDLIHPVPQGALAYIAAIENALQQWVDDEKTIPGECGV